MTAAVQTYTLNPTTGTLFQVLGLPKLVLRLVPAQGKKATEQQLTTLRHRLALFMKSVLATQWAELQRDVPDALQTGVRTRAQKLARGLSSTAATILS
jgi:hypothetical protein